MASQGFVPEMTGGRDGTNAFGRREQIGSPDAKPVFGPGGAGCSGVALPSGKVGKMQPQPRRNWSFTAKGPTRGDRTKRPFGIVPIDDRTAMLERRKAQRDRKDIEAGLRLFGAVPVPVTGQRTLSDRWNAGSTSLAG